jgi:heme/copper-type cytochrome/quinol oxidase subunit 2
MKKMLFFGLVVLMLLAACQSKFVENDITGQVVGVIEYGNVKEERVGTEFITVKEFTMTISKEGYSPHLLQVNKGDTVRIIAYAKDTNFGFVLPAYGINEYLEENNYKTIEFVADQDGTFAFFSNVYSGPNTKNMNGKLIVSE